MVPLQRTRSSVRLFCFGRPGRNFTESEQLSTRRLQPVLSALDRHQKTITAWRAAWAVGRPAAEQVVDCHGITPRELAVLSLFAEGLNLNAAGRRLGISPRTVAKHQENLQRKLATSDRLTTVLRAQRMGLVPTETSKA
jgi:DNA-binding NarL/FixJ family response regulator